MWVGTGEANASSYTSWGDGVYKSTDGGRSFTHMGLKDTHHIGRIVIHPTNPDIVYVAAAGHLVGPQPRSAGSIEPQTAAERGPTSSTSARTRASSISRWTHAIPDVLYAAAYARRSDRFDDFDSVGINILEGGGIYKTTDGGDTWVKLTSGLPAEPNRPYRPTRRAQTARSGLRDRRSGASARDIG